ncbi:hypothetical protein [Desulfotalea psychrophila]|uniref:Uncharacterized protein n=1 Tax=Desulfotalea psychrophila (strain LSv54 / DSM 12343) TaxID=177439 RepID=Q6AR87_DESPS|nr:hypothetical protein [Desulfotalea psychrophila]CAG35137.1 unknown protein [Desulfotalea psychrophila LSv54]
MPKHITSVACLRVIKDELTGLMSLQDLVKVGFYNKKEGPHFPGFLLFSKWYRDGGDANSDELFTVKITLLDSAEKAIGVVGEQEFTIKEGTYGGDFGTRVEGVEAPGPGRYFFEVSCKSEGGRWKKVTQIPVVLREKDSDAE